MDNTFADNAAQETVAREKEIVESLFAEHVQPVINLVAREDVREAIAKVMKLAMFRTVQQGVMLGVDTAQKVVRNSAMNQIKEEVRKALETTSQDVSHL